MLWNWNSQKSNTSVTPSGVLCRPCKAKGKGHKKDGKGGKKGKATGKRGKGEGSRNFSIFLIRVDYCIIAIALITTRKEAEKEADRRELQEEARGIPRVRGP